MNTCERPELVVSLNQKRVVGTVERQPCRARLGKQLARVLGEKRELRQIRPAGTAVKATSWTPRLESCSSTRYPAPSSSRTLA